MEIVTYNYVMWLFLLYRLFGNHALSNNFPFLQKIRITAKLNSSASKHSIMTALFILLFHSINEQIMLKSCAFKFLVNLVARIN